MRRITLDIRPYHTPFLFGLIRRVEELLNEGAEVDSKDSRGRLVNSLLN